MIKNYLIAPDALGACMRVKANTRKQLINENAAEIEKVFKNKHLLEGVRLTHQQISPEFGDKLGVFLIGIIELYNRVLNQAIWRCVIQNTLLKKKTMVLKPKCPNSNRPNFNHRTFIVTQCSLTNRLTVKPKPIALPRAFYNRGFLIHCIRRTTASRIKSRKQLACFPKLFASHIRSLTSMYHSGLKRLWGKFSPKERNWISTCFPNQLFKESRKFLASKFHKRCLKLEQEQTLTS